MKRIFLLFAMVGLTALSSCSNDDDHIDRDTYSEVFEVTNVNFNAGNDYGNLYNLTPTIFNSDNLLIYELSGTNNMDEDVWTLIPKLYYFPEGTAQYGYDFSSSDFSIYIDADFDRGLLPTSFTQNKVFRVVIVPGYFSETIDVNNYNEVIQALNIRESDIQMIK